MNPTEYKQLWAQHKADQLAPGYWTISEAETLTGIAYKSLMKRISRGNLKTVKKHRITLFREEELYMVRTLADPVEVPETEPHAPPDIKTEHASTAQN